MRALMHVLLTESGVCSDSVNAYNLISGWRDFMEPAIRESLPLWIAGAVSSELD